MSLMILVVLHDQQEFRGLGLLGRDSKGFKWLLLGVAGPVLRGRCGGSRLFTGQGQVCRFEVSAA